MAVLFTSKQINGVIISELEITTISFPSVSSTKILYITKPDDNTIEIYDIANSTAPVYVGDFSGGNLSTLAALVIFTLSP